MKSLMVWTKFIPVVLFCSLLAACGQSEMKADPDPRADRESPPADSLKIELVGVDSTSVFELLRQGHAIDYQSSAMGVFVKAIDSVCADDQYYWVYSVNDTMAQTSADKYLTADGDRVIWHFRKLGD